VRELAQRTPKRDTAPSSLSRVLEIFYGGNTDVNTVVLFDTIGEAVDYHSYLDPYFTRVAAAYCGIVFELTRYKMAWLGQGTLERIEFKSEKFDFVISVVCEEYALMVAAKPGTAKENLLDTVSASIEVLRKEIGC
jgi:hypothetical protein